MRFPGVPWTLHLRLSDAHATRSLRNSEDSPALELP